MAREISDQEIKEMIRNNEVHKIIRISDLYIIVETSDEVFHPGEIEYKGLYYSEEEKQWFRTPFVYNNFDEMMIGVVAHRNGDCHAGAYAIRCLGI